ncbi:Rhodanese-related sulfurtransferase [Streptomyces sp. SceaMP-e96]|uniref:rhodanese-like domain-containing protein n=1 Tax=unclassified Streptomyces TaxID=2593676 RepID=UPI000823BC10|nr:MULTISPECIES: rhodanese-like domain-containing protein [unclassified Streptomyces]MYT16716.1 rhodanese-like domain-containing protein [Streptomyces sp. SID4951]SCK34710.1 Rhodanese-related sulfurtransferase [Streptomyces sp. SceaMP-e96]
MSPLRRGARRLTPERAHQRTAGHERAVLLDVREPHEWQAGHAPGAVHAPLSELAAGGGLPAAARNRPLVVICRSGQRSRQAARLLRAHGAQAVDVKGGMNAWAVAGLPVVDAHGNSGSIA